MFSPTTKWVVTAKAAGRVMAVGIVVLSLASVAHASPILTLFNTGVFANGSVVPNGTVDLHYTLVSGPVGPTPLQAHTSAGGFPVPPWMADDALSTWIIPNNAASSPPGNYDYRTTFDLTGFAANSASLTINWATDNGGLDVLLNGVSTGHTSPSFTTFSTFALSSGFSSGINTLDFLVNNGPGATGNPTGLRVELSGTANTPEPASMLLFGAGLVGLGMISRRRAQQGSKR